MLIMDMKTREKRNNIRQVTISGKPPITKAWQEKEWLHYRRGRSSSLGHKEDELVMVSQEWKE